MPRPIAPCSPRATCDNVKGSSLFQWNCCFKAERTQRFPPHELTPKAALTTHALQTLPLAPWDKRRGVWAARRAGYPTGRVPDALLRREAFGVRASLAPLFRRRSPKVRFRGLMREPLGETLSSIFLPQFLLMPCQFQPA